MKPYIVIALLILTLGLQAQVKVNPNVGLTLSKLSEGDLTSVHASFVGGLDLRFGGIVNFIPGLYFGNVGTNVDYSDNTVTYQFDNSINTLQLRTLIGFNIVNTKVLRVRAVGGPSLHYTVQSLNIDKDNLQNAIAYLNVGGGLDLGILTIDLRYEYGLTPVFNKSGTQSISLDTRNNILILSVGLVF